MKAFLSKRATRAAERLDERWRQNADDPGVFAREFLEAVDLLETSRGPGTLFPTAKHPSLRRLLLRKSRCHIYFEVDDAKQTIRILLIWEATSATGRRSTSAGRRVRSGSTR